MSIQINKDITTVQVEVPKTNVAIENAVTEITVQTSRPEIVIASAGVQGPVGPRGFDTGTSGTSGTSGVNGTSGTSGIGSNGTSGTSGSNGITGAGGTAGSSGTSGLNGTFFGSSGTSGVSGSGGTSGTSGTSGVSGSSGTSGTSGSDGTSGTSGTSGVSGSSGTSGINGVSTNLFLYEADANSFTGAPSSGHILWNNATQISATQININHLTDTPITDIDIFLSLLQVGQKLTIQDRNDSANYQIWTISATPTYVPTTYWTIPVTLVSSAGTGTTGFANNHKIFVATSTVSGTSGTSGTSGDITLFNAFTGSINTYTSSNDLVRNRILQTTASLNTYTGSNDSVISRILQTTASLNLKTGSYAVTGSNLFIGNQTITGSLIVSASTNLTGSVTINESRIDNAWTSYTPTWEAPTPPAIGNGTITGAYKVIGKTCFVRGRITMGSTTTYGSGDWSIGLPVAAINAYAIQIPASLLDGSGGTGWYNALMNGAVALNTISSQILANLPPSFGGSTAGGISSIFPFTWGSGDALYFNGSYEIA